VEASVAQLLAEDAVLLKEVLDDIPLLAVDPGGERDEEEFESWWERGAHEEENRLVAFERQGGGLIISTCGLSGRAESSPDVELIIGENHCGFLNDPIFVQDEKAKRVGCFAIVNDWQNAQNIFAGKSRMGGADENQDFFLGHS